MSKQEKGPFDVLYPRQLRSVVSPVGRSIRNHRDLKGIQIFIEKLILL